MSDSRSCPKQDVKHPQRLPDLVALSVQAGAHHTSTIRGMQLRSRSRYLTRSPILFLGAHTWVVAPALSSKGSCNPLLSVHIGPAAYWASLKLGYCHSAFFCSGASQRPCVEASWLSSAPLKAILITSLVSQCQGCMVHLQSG